MKKDNVELICDIGELAGLFQHTGHIQDFLQKVANTVSRHMRAHVCSIFLYDEVSEILTLKATEGLSKEGVNSVTLKLGEGITGMSLKELRPICEPRASRNPHYRHFPSLKEEEFEAFLAVPILRGLSRIGALVLQHKKADFFDDNDIKALKAIAAQLAASLENAKLLMDIQNQGKIKVRNTVKKPQGELTFIRGNGASEGVALGSAVVLGGREGEVFLDGPQEDQYRSTLKDFQLALKRSETQIEELQREMESKFSDVASLIFSTHLLMLQDSGFSGSMEESIRGGLHPASAITSVVNRYLQIFTQSPNPRLQEKVQDVKDLGHRLLRNLSKEKYDDGDYLGQVVVAREMLPSELIKMAAQHAEGLLLYGGGASAHVSILAKSLGIPVIFTDDVNFDRIRTNDNLILDGFQGNVFINAEPRIHQEYLDLKAHQENTKKNKDDVKSRTLTRDGEEIHILANINLLSDLRMAKQQKAEGVGLYRSEFPFIIRSDFPTEEEQYRVYKKLLEEMPGKEVVLRTLDIGGDKVLSYLPQGSESNPFLGLRAIRFSLQNKSIFQEQLRAMLRAGYGHELRIMFPLISSLDDFLEAKDVVNETILALQTEGVKHNEKPLIGAMIELPSAVEMANELASHGDFMCVGTNDLVQYILGVDRTNEAVSHFYIAHHPAVFRSLQRLVRAANNNSCPISICGEVAADPHMIPFLIGAGFKKLSVNPKLIPQVQKVIQGISWRESQVLSEKLLSLGTVKEVHEVLDIHE